MRLMLLGSGGARNATARYRMKVTASGGTVGLLASGITTACHPVMLVTAEGTLLLATGFDGVKRMRQNERRLTAAGVPCPKTAIVIADETDISDNSDLQVIQEEYVTKTFDYTEFGAYAGSSSNGNPLVSASTSESYKKRSTDYANVYNFGSAVRPTSVTVVDMDYAGKVSIWGLFFGTVKDGTPTWYGKQRYNWLSQKFTLTYQNVAYSSTNGTSNIYSGRYQAFLRYVDKDGNVSDPSPISTDTLLTGAPYIMYTNVEVPTDPRVVKRQIFRNCNGSSDVFYLDIETTDLTSTELISYKTDNQLRLEFPQPVFDDNGYNLFYLYGEPGNDKPYMAEFNSTIFAAGRRVYTSGVVSVTNGSATVVGIGTNWTRDMAGRRITIGSDQYTVIDVDILDQEITLDRGHEGVDDPFANYAIEPYYANGNLLVWSEPGYPEAWPIGNAITLPEDGDDITGLKVFANALWILKRRSVYMFNYTTNPGRDGDYKPVTSRGCLSQNLAIAVQGRCYMLDRSGIHIVKPPQNRYDYTFDSVPDHASAAIDDLFRSETDGMKINFKADPCQWSSAESPEQKTIRFFIPMNGDYLPRHAICHNYQRNSWWVEEYPFYITAASSQTLAGDLPYLGGEGGEVYKPDIGPLDLVSTSNTRHQLDTMHSPVALSLVDTPPSCVGAVFAIVKGRGRGQWRRVLEQSGNEIILDAPLLVYPNDESEFQIGAIPYRVVTPEYTRIRSDTDATHYLSVGYRRTENPLEAHVIITEGGEDIRGVSARDSWGSVSSDVGDHARMIDFTNRGGQADFNMDRRRERDIPTSNSVQATIEGFSGMEKPVYNDITFAGVSRQKELTK